MFFFFPVSPLLLRSFFSAILVLHLLSFIVVVFFRFRHFTFLPFLPFPPSCPPFHLTPPSLNPLPPFNQRAPLSSLHFPPFHLLPVPPLLLPPFPPFAHSLPLFILLSSSYISFSSSSSHFHLIYFFRHTPMKLIYRFLFPTHEK